MKKQKKAQVIIVSILIILFIFLLVLTLFFESLLTRPFIGNEKTKILETEATRLSDSLLLTGHPENWQNEETNIQKIGFMTDGKLNIQKINKLQELATTNYDLTKIYLGIQNDYFIKITYTNDSEIQTIQIPNDIPNEKKYAITRQRATLMQINEKNILVNISLTIYSK